MGGHGRLGFLKDPRAAPDGTVNFVCGASRKSKREGTTPNTKKKPEKKPRRNNRHIITMLLHHQKNSYQVKALLDTGCSINLINQQTVERLNLPKNPHKNPRIIENFTGQTVENAGQFHTGPVQLQHRNHFSKETFEISPMEEGIDIFLSFSWVEEHPPQGTWSTEEIRFNSPGCLEKCTQYEMVEFSLSWDESILSDPKARTIGHVSAVNDDPLGHVPMEFRQYLGIMGKEAADALPEHCRYDCKIELKDGTTAPWGPIYPLSEVKLQTLREWLKEMEKTGKIKRSTSSTGSPILFVHKPNGRGIRLCVDY